LNQEIARLTFPLLGLEQLADLGPPEWMVDSVVPEGNVVIFGPPGSCKSFIALDMALCVASGIDWHGHPVKQGKVVYVASEGARGMHQRVDVWLQQHDLTKWDVPDLLFIPFGVNLLDESAATKLADTLDVLLD
ncbi:AAA family ATPase, partial [Paraburkholderia azotifigens]|uniref:AAA family ATPase n=1 Tax=Paraburkholderia azotifigens TaxID=2057004 RepID=UPI0031809E6A